MEMHTFPTSFSASVSFFFLVQRFCSNDRLPGEAQSG